MSIPSIAAIRTGDRRALARAISIVEDGRSSSAQLLADAFARPDRAFRIGITGAPGAGKSTLTSALVSLYRDRGLSVGVIAVDPSSPFSGGSILGDRIRMQHHVDDPDVFVRSLASRGHLGGLSAAVPKVASLFDAAGFDETIIETVGVGQAEVEIVSEADATVVVVTPGWGDSIQANKAGLLEIGDVFVVNKADREGATQAAGDLESMLDLGAERPWRPPVVSTVATTGVGVSLIGEALDDLIEHLGLEGLAQRRHERIRTILRSAVRDHLMARVDETGTRAVDAAVARVVAGELDPWAAATELASQ